MRKTKNSTANSQEVIDGIVITDDTQAKAETKINERREALKALSTTLKPLVDAGKYQTINEALLASYKNEEHQVFKTYQQWQRDGYQVNKGAKAFDIWAKPLSKRAEEKGEQLTDDQHDYFPICFLFSNAQVRVIQKK